MRVLLVCVAALALMVHADIPPVSDDDLLAAIDAAAAAVPTPKNAQAPPGAAKPAQQAQPERPRREPRDYVLTYKHSEANNYPQQSKRHMLLFSPPEKMEANEAMLLEAADLILNAPRVTDGPKGTAAGNQGGGKVLFLLVDMSDPANQPIMHRCSIPSKTSKAGIVRLAQFPTSKPLEIFKPVGKYKASAKYLSSFLQEVRAKGDGATRALMTSEKVKKFGNLDTAQTLIRTVGATAKFWAKRPEDVVLFSYLPTCPHCQDFNATFLKVAKECEEAQCGVKFLLFDASTNEHDLFEATTEFPQVHLLSAHQKKDPFQFDDFPNGAGALRYFIDKNRWFKEQPKLLKPEDAPLQMWDEDVDPMTAQYFNRYLRSVPEFVVFFYAHSSRQSKVAMPDFAKAANKLGSESLPLIKIDCEEEGEHGEHVNAKLCGMFKIKGYPSIMHVNTAGYQHGDDIADYADALDFENFHVDGIYNWLKALVSESTKDAARRIAEGKARAAAATGKEL